PTQLGHLSPLIALVIAYLAGSVPAAYLAGKWRGVDLRKHGSGNLGATNVVRVLGGRMGAAVFAFDVLKGFLPVLLLPRFTDTTHPEMLALALGIAAILGHVKPIFLLGRGGGKGVATATGVFLGLAWLPTLISFAVWLAVFFVRRYVSLASLAGAVALPLAFLATGAPLDDPEFLAAVMIAAFVFYTHRANIGRLRRGEEHRFVRSAPGAVAMEPQPPNAA
ncbi:MAG: glycerol-3-phosphate 1-O-acyltransferase PlsY, partial [Gemmatimonadaceae bacterium]